MGVLIVDIKLIEKLNKFFDSMPEFERLSYINSEYNEMLGDRWNDLSDDEFSDEMSCLKDYFEKMQVDSDRQAVISINALKEVLEILEYMRATEKEHFENCDEGVRPIHVFNKILSVEKAISELGLKT